MLKAIVRGPVAELLHAGLGSEGGVLFCRGPADLPRPIDRAAVACLGGRLRAYGDAPAGWTVRIKGQEGGLIGFKPDMHARSLTRRVEWRRCHRARERIPELGVPRSAESDPGINCLVHAFISEEVEVDTGITVVIVPEARSRLFGGHVAQASGAKGATPFRIGQPCRRRANKHLKLPRQQY